MPCYSPLHGYRARTLTANGKRGIVFNVKDGFSDMPLTVPCGQCLGCRLERSRQWAVRLLHEKTQHDLAVFVTLTYDDDHLPEDGSLHKEHFQLFMKRLRKRHGAQIRYFHCGEYGEQGRRPHYHAILFGIDFADRKLHSTNGSGNKLYSSDTLAKTWGHGFCLIGDVTFESAAYVARYVVKKVTGEMAESHYRHVLPDGEVVNLEPEYVTMSRDPPIGGGWFDKFASDVFPADRVVINGKECQPPRIYRKLLEKRDEQMAKVLKYRRIARANEHQDDQTTARLIVRHTCKAAQVNLYKRTL